MLINFLKLDSVMAMPEGSAKHYLSLYWGGAMTGRFLGAIALRKNMDATKRYAFMAMLGLAMFALLLLVNSGSGLKLVHAWPMAVLIAANFLAFVVAGPNPSRALGLFALGAIALLGMVIVSSGPWAMWAIVAIGLFNSILWSNIFTLAIDGLGDDTSQGSSLLVMMIVGGALIPPLQGAIIDFIGDPRSSTWGFHISFVLPLLCYGFLAWYGFRGSKHAPVA